MASSFVPDLLRNTSDLPDYLYDTWNKVNENMLALSDVLQTLESELSLTSSFSPELLSVTFSFPDTVYLIWDKINTNMLAIAVEVEAMESRLDELEG